MQLGVTITSLGDRRPRRAGARARVRHGDGDRARRRSLALLIITFLHVVIGELVPKGIALGHPERTALARLDAGARVLPRLRAADLGAAASRPSWCCALLGLEPPGRRARGALRGRAADAPLELGRAGRDRARRAGDALQGLRLRRQGGRGRDGAAARGGRALGRRCRPRRRSQAVLDSPYTRYPVYRETLDDIVGILHVRDLVRGDARPRHRRRRRSRRSCARPTSSRRRRTSPRCWPSSGARTSTWRSWSTSTARWRASSRSRTCSRRSSARSRTSSTCPTSPVERVDERHDPHRRHVPDRRLQRAVRRRPAGRGLPHDRRLRLRRSSAAPPSPATRSTHDGLVFHVDSVEGQRIDRLTVTFQPWHQRDEPGADDAAGES